MTPKSVLMIGAGSMSIEYAKVLRSLGITPTVLGRGQASAEAFEESTGISAGTGSLANQLAALNELPETAIVTVNAQYLADITARLAKVGIKKMLVEKPGALSLQEMEKLLQVIEATGAEVRVGYNRRFIESVRHARRLIAEDGGVQSVSFDFSEPARRIATLDKPKVELDTWFYGNSSHVVDLAFHFFGLPEELSGRVQGGVSWHPAAGVFVGSGIGAEGKLISWHANWMAPGRWGVEVRTAEHRLIFQPIEKLRIQTHASFAEVEVDLDDQADRDFKPGFFRQVRAFLFGEEIEYLPSLQEHARYMRCYEVVRLGGRESFETWQSRK